MLHGESDDVQGEADNYMGFGKLTRLDMWQKLLVSQWVSALL